MCLYMKKLKRALFFFGFGFHSPCHLWRMNRELVAFKIMLCFVLKIVQKCIQNKYRRKVSDLFPWDGNLNQKFLTDPRERALQKTNQKYTTVCICATIPFKENKKVN